jgi:predicted acylesterase/phospholipase RssA
MAVDPDVEEVRVALALNGGVSLAVWMGGCAVELDRARRTRADGDERTTYGALCRAFRRELVIDVMTGSSAGGINGALLAAAMTSGGALEPGFVRGRWLDLGDFTELLQPLSNGRPLSLMRGDYFADQLDRTFRDVMGDRPPTGSVPALDITATDLAGTSLLFRDDWGGALRAREHRIRFRFRDEQHYEPGNLATAARASASFPVAFEPWQVKGGGEHGIEALGQISSPRWVVDGGLLDNAPIRAALNLIPTRPATRQVKRFLCYLNGDPDAGPGDGDAESPLPSPAPGHVIGAMVNLPRTAPFADHLLALQDLSRRSRLTFDAELALIGVDLGALEATAAALLPTYAKRRRLRALQDVLPDPGAARQALRHLEQAKLDLPWIPQSLGVAPEGEWRWGFQTGRRVQHLALDLIRVALPTSTSEERRRLLQARAAIDARASSAEEGRDRFAAMVDESIRMIAQGEDVARAVNLIDGVAAGEGPAQRAAVVDTADDLLAIADLLATIQGVDVRAGLFGDGTRDPTEHFLRRVLAIEVVRRSLFDVEPIDDGQDVSFAQLTPEAPDLLFTARPLTEVRRPSADQKLCGTLFAHFSGFYRRSWRANDFLWGRLDAATRVTEMLVSSVRTQALASTDQEQPWIRLADDVCGRGAEHDELIEEALADASGTYEGSLVERLGDALRDDLIKADGGRLTRVIAARAAQFEVVQDELRELVDEATKDVALGCTRHTLGLDGLDLTTSAGALAAVKRLREVPQDTFPKRLGRVGNDEWTSDLGVRTGTHAGLVGLALTRQTGGAAAAPLTPVRGLLLPMSGAVSARIRNRLAVIAAFWAAAMYLAARIATTESSAVADLGTVELPELLLAVVAWLIVTGTVAVPGLRAWTRTGIARVWAALAGLILAISGGVGAACLAVFWGPLTWAQLIVAPGAADPPTWVLAGPLVLASAAFFGPRVVGTSLRRLAEPAWRGGVSLLATLASAAIVVWWSWDKVIDGFDGMWWQTTAACAALFAAPATALTYFVLWPLLRGRLRRL